MKRTFRMLALLAGLLSSPVFAACPSHFAAGDTNYISKLNLLIDCVVAGGGSTSPLTTKGDLWCYTTTDDRCAIGSNGKILTADSGQSSGWGWKDTLDGVTIGGTTPAAGTFTTGSFTSVQAGGGGVQANDGIQAVTLFGGYGQWTVGSAPIPPTAGTLLFWADSTSKTLRTIDSSSVETTTVKPDTGASNNFLTAISANGIISKAQPGVSDLSGFGSGVATFLGTPSGANLASALTTALPASKGGTGLTALGTGIATALGINTGSAGAPVLYNGAGGTPSSIALASGTGLPISTGVSGLGTNVATALAVNQGSTGSINPMTTAGDIIIGGTSGASTRLAAGSTAGHVLTSNGSGAAPSWQAGAFMGASGGHSTTTSVSNTTVTVVPLDTESSPGFDTNSILASTGKFTVPTGGAGKWTGMCSVTWNNSATGSRYLAARLNGTTDIPGAYLKQPASNSLAQQITFPMRIYADADYVECYVYQDSGVQQSIGAAAPSGSQSWGAFWRVTP